MTDLAPAEPAAAEPATLRGTSFPLRLYSPTKLGYKLTKYLVAIEFTAERPGGYWEDQGYPWFGGL